MLTSIWTAFGTIFHFRFHFMRVRFDAAAYTTMGSLLMRLYPYPHREDLHTQSQTYDTLSHPRVVYCVLVNDVSSPRRNVNNGQDGRIRL